MRGSKQSEEYRLRMLRRLQDKDGRATPAKVLEAEKVIANYSQEKADADKAIPRLEAGLPKPDLCPRCWFMKGHEIALYAVPADDPDKFDRMKCRTCGYAEDRDA